VITIVVRMQVLPDNQAAYESLMDSVAEKVRTHEADGVPYYAWAKSADVPDTYVVIEAYRDLAAHKAHMASAWVQESIPISRSLVEGKFDIQQYVTPGAEAVSTFVSNQQP
jgi:quinol monooxygenase YgiN